jgi:hypothetical protein
MELKLTYNSIEAESNFNPSRRIGGSIINWISDSIKSHEFDIIKTEDGIEIITDTGVGKVTPKNLYYFSLVTLWVVLGLTTYDKE